MPVQSYFHVNKFNYFMNSIYIFKYIFFYKIFIKKNSLKIIKTLLFKNTLNFKKIKLHLICINPYEIYQVKFLKKKNLHLLTLIFSIKKNNKIYLQHINLYNLNKYFLIFKTNKKK